MIEGVIIKQLNKFEDSRGWLAEIFRHDETKYRPAMSYVSSTKPGIVRGPHEHVNQTDLFVFIGPGDFDLYLWDRRNQSPTRGQSVKVAAGQANPAMIMVPPGVVHAYKCISETDGWCVNFPDRLYKGRDKREEVDEIRWENEIDSPYKIE